MGNHDHFKRTQNRGNPEKVQDVTQANRQTSEKEQEVGGLSCSALLVFQQSYKSQMSEKVTYNVTHPNMMHSNCLFANK